MSTLEELRAVIDHITACTKDPDAWRRGLTPADLTVLPITVVDAVAASSLLATIKANHPDLFDPRTGVRVTPAPPSTGPPPGQVGVGADAMKAAEDALARQNSATADLDLHVVGAILNAHSQSERGSERLRQLQDEIRNAVQARTDLDTPAGARDFQRYLIDKLRQIGAVVDAASLDSGSRAALLSAWTELYRSADRIGEVQGEATGRSSADAGPDGPASSDSGLPVYGADLPDTYGAEPDGDYRLPETDRAATVIGNTPAQATPFDTKSVAALPLSGWGAPPSSSGPAALPRPDLLSESAIPGEQRRWAGIGDSAPEPLFDAEQGDTEGLSDEPASTDGTEPTDGGEGTDGVEPSDAASDAATAVLLPDGSTATTRSVAIADAIRATLAGTPIPEAFAAQGITVPPPGNVVPHPVEPGRVVAGDVGMFTDRQALAVDAERAWFGGRIQPVAAVSGPSFLGWLHPPAPSTGAPDAAPTGTASSSPSTASSPTRSANLPDTAR
jgi:hypothetical protein